MNNRPKQKVSNLIRAYPHVWDHGGMRAVVRENFARVLACRRALGAEVFVSPNGEIRTVMHTCNSRACPSCGYWQTLRWMHEVATRFPDVPCSGIVFSMPDTFWEIFRTNRRLMPALADLGAGVLQDWALERYGAEVPILVVPHTFNAKLKFNVHLHVLAGREGLDRTGNRLVQNIHYYAGEVTRRWRHTLVDFLIDAIDRGQVRSSMPVEQLRDLVQGQRDRWWKPMVRNYASQRAVLQYIARYLRRPPMAEYRILSSPTGTVRFLYKDKKSHEIRVAEHSAEDFLLLLADQVPDRYRHGVRYFGLLAPRAKALRYAAFLRLLGRRPPPPLRRLRWAASLLATFGYDPLRDSLGERMTWSHRLPPMLSGAT